MLSGAHAGLLGLSWLSFKYIGDLLASFGVLLGMSWGSLGLIWGALGALLASWSVFLGALEGLFGLSLVASALF